ncbi:hypothetical protein BH09MYX1_BH09MYX1_35360 [soil metagenome]
MTAPGTVLVEWDSSKSTRAEVTTATVGAHSSKDYTLTVSNKDAPSFKLGVHVETAPLDYKEGGSDIHQTSPVSIKVTLKENTGWDLSAKCGDGPNYQMPSIGADGGFVTPLGMIQSCNVVERRQAGVVFTSSWDIGFTINVLGDGTIRAFPPDDVKIE